MNFREVLFKRNKIKVSWLCFQFLNMIIKTLIGGHDRVVWSMRYSDYFDELQS